MQRGIGGVILKKSFPMPELIITSKGKDYVCLYDKSDHALISQYTWHINSGGYAVCYSEGKTILMHRLILGVLDHREIEVDHKYHKHLDNRRSKIRVCTHGQNKQNSRKLKSGTSQYKGVYLDKNRWHAQLGQGPKVRNLGRYSCEATAARVYDQAALNAFKDFACLNFSKGETIQQSIIPGF